VAAEAAGAVVAAAADAAADDDETTITQPAALNSRTRCAHAPLGRLPSENRVRPHGLARLLCNDLPAVLRAVLCGPPALPCQGVSRRHG
jgi:hypothetical protein